MQVRPATRQNGWGLEVRGYSSLFLGLARNGARRGGTQNPPRFGIASPATYIPVMLLKPIESPPDVARRFVEDMRAFHAEPNAIKQDEIAAPQLHALKQDYRGKLRSIGSQGDARADAASRVIWSRGLVIAGHLDLALLPIFGSLCPDASLATADGAWRRVDSATRPCWLNRGRETRAVAGLTFHFKRSGLFLSHAATRSF